MRNAIEWNHLKSHFRLFVAHIFWKERKLEGLSNLCGRQVSLVTGRIKKYEAQYQKMWP